MTTDSITAPKPTTKVTEVNDAVQTTSSGGNEVARPKPKDLKYTKPKKDYKVTMPDGEVRYTGLITPNNWEEVINAHAESNARADKNALRIRLQMTLLKQTQMQVRIVGDPSP